MTMTTSLDCNVAEDALGGQEVAVNPPFLLANHARRTLIQGL